MSEYYELNIYKDQYKMLIEVLHTTKHIRKDFKRTIGEELRLTASENITLIQKANATKNNLEKRMEFLEKLKDNLEVLLVVIRSSRDVNIIPKSAYARLIEPLLSVRDQCRKWYNATKKKSNNVNKT